MSGMTSERLEELRRIAEAATPGPWRISDDGPADRFVIASADREHIAETTQVGSFTEDLANAHHIATFDPPTVLVLLDEIERLRRAVEAATRMAEILRGLEWSGWDERFRAHICPVCGGYRSKKKHFPDCDLNKALSFLRDVGRE